VLADAIKKMCAAFGRYAAEPALSGGVPEGLEAMLASATKSAPPSPQNPLSSVGAPGTAEDAAPRAQTRVAPGLRGEGRGRSQEVLLAAMDSLRRLCCCERAMRPHVTALVQALAPLLASSQPEHVQSSALALGCRLARLEPDVVWLSFIRYLPVSEQWPSTPPAGCQPLRGIDLPAVKLPPAEMVANTRRLLDEVRKADARDEL
jgi:hypothetical protein